MKTREEFKENCKLNIRVKKNVLKAWQKVQRQSKKDGNDFAYLCKNFTNAKIDKNYSQIIVRYYYGNGMYDYDSIDIENKYTVNAIFDEITKKIREYEEIINHYEKRLHFIDYMFDKVDEATDVLIKLAKSCGFESWEIGDYVKNSCYCWRE